MGEAALKKKIRACAFFLELADFSPKNTRNENYSADFI
jgi:hypothetical protein